MKTWWAAIAAGMVGFAAQAVAPGAADATSTLPVLLVPGYNGSPADFNVLKQALAQAGYDERRMQALELPGSWGSSNVDNAAAIEKASRELFERYHQRVVVIAHSMGGLAARYSVKFLDGSRWVDTVITLGTMNRGLPPGGFTSPCSAPSGFVRYFDEMCARGHFIRALNSGSSVPGSAVYINIFSPSDEVVPERSAFLPGAENIDIQGVTHSGPGGYLENPAVVRVLIEQLRVGHELHG